MSLLFSIHTTISCLYFASECCHSISISNSNSHIRLENQNQPTKNSQSLDGTKEDLHRNHGFLVIFLCNCFPINNILLGWNTIEILLRMSTADNFNGYYSMLIACLTALENALIYFPTFNMVLWSLTLIPCNSIFDIYCLCFNSTLECLFILFPSKFNI